MIEPPAHPIAVRIRIHGGVQGVWYRAWTVKRARAFGLSGWVRNCANGSVEAQFVGAAATVEAMIEACRTGPPLAQVSHIDRHAGVDDGAKDFREMQDE